MSTEEINVKIAESLGWTDIKYVPALCSHPAFSPKIAFGNDPCGEHQRIPNFHGSLDACHEMEQSLRRCEIEWSKYRHVIETSLPYADQIHATAPQRCLAYLKTKNLL